MPWAETLVSSSGGSPARPQWKSHKKVQHCKPWRHRPTATPNAPGFQE